MYPIRKNYFCMDCGERLYDRARLCCGCGENFENGVSRLIKSLEKNKVESFFEKLKFKKSDNIGGNDGSFKKNKEWACQDKS